MKGKCLPATALALVAIAPLGSCSRGRPETAPPPAPEDQGLYGQAIELQRNDFIGEAEAVWRALLARFPETPRAPEALFWLGLDQRSRGDAREALATFGRLVARFPNGPFADAALSGAAGIHLAAGSDRDVAHAREELELLVARFPGSPFAPEARIGLARIAEGDGRLDAAVALYDGILRDPATPERDRTGIAGRIARIDGMRAVSPDDAARILAAEFRLVRGQPAEALKALEGIAARRTGSVLEAEAAYAEGLARALLGERAPAEALFARAAGAADPSLRADAGHARALLGPTAD